MCASIFNLVLGIKILFDFESHLCICLSFLASFLAQAAWVLIKQNAEYKPLQFLTFVFVYRIFEKLKAFEPPVSPTFTVSGCKSPHETPIFSLSDNILEMLSELSTLFNTIISNILLYMVIAY